MSSQRPSFASQVGVDHVFRILVDAVEDYAICVLDATGRVTTWNIGAERLFGYTSQEIVGSDCAIFYGHDDLPTSRCERDLEQARRLGKMHSEGWRVRKDGARFWGNATVTAIRDTGGEVAGFIHITRDLSERVLAAEHRHADEERFRLLVSNVRDYAIFMLDPTGHVATWNAGARGIKGYTANEIIGRHFSVFYPESDVRAGKCEMELEVAARDGRFEDEGWRIRKDGTRFWANVVITALRDSEGSLVGFGKVTRDLTERRIAEQHRLAAEERFRRLVESVRDYAIFLLDPSGHVASWNTGAERINGYRAEEIIGTHFSKFYPAEDIAAGKCEMELDVAGREGRFEDEGWRLRKDGSQFWANVVISAIRDDDGRLVGFSKVTRDLTERRHAEEERAARVAAEEANRTKDQFLAMLGHELRNPLAPIVTALQLIKLRDQTRSAREYEVIERQVRQMTRLVDDLLDVSRIGQGKIELIRIPLDVRHVLAKAVESALPLFERKAQQFDVHTPQRPLMVVGDEARLVQVFANLLTNASKYTDNGGQIRLVVRREQERVAIEIRDNGTGIAPSLLPRVFDLFVQGERDAARSEGGMGLGLTLVRRLVELHDGAVEAHSAGLGKGSSFIVRLPYDHAAVVDGDDGEDAPSLVRHVSPDAKRVLLVDDNADARNLLGDVLRSAGHTVATAADALQALDLLGDVAPQVAILDIGLPGMDGYELARQIRARPGGQEIKLVALSGYGQPSDHVLSERAGFDLHLVKPVEIQRILDCLREPRHPPT